MKTVICPVCNGTGKIETSRDDSTTLHTIWYTVCHGCGGKGWVEVQDDQPQWYPYVPYTPPSPTDWYPGYPHWHPYYDPYPFTIDNPWDTGYISPDCS